MYRRYLIDTFSKVSAILYWYWKSRGDNLSAILDNSTLTTLIVILLTTHTDGNSGGMVFTAVCLSVCFSALHAFVVCYRVMGGCVWQPVINKYVTLCYISTSQKLMQLGSQKVTQKCSTMSPENSFTLESKETYQMSRSRVTKTAPAWVFALLWVLASSSQRLGNIPNYSQSHGYHRFTVLAAAYDCNSVWLKRWI